MERHNEISEFIWNIKEHIRDEYKEKDYEEVILPFTLLRRIDCVLEKTHEQVVKTYEQYKNKATPEVLDQLLKKASGQNFYNISAFTLLGLTNNYMLTNPPFGDDWKNIREFVEAEALKKECGRFGAGTPDVSDGSFLFLQHMISKMNPQGSTIGIVFNGSPLFNGDAGGGWSNIRGWIMDEPHDLLDCIVALPKDLFYGTGIGTYIWILNNKKPANRKNKVQLINAVHPRFTKKIKSLGKKQYEISEDGINLITEIYKTYKDYSIEVEEDGKKRTIEISKIYDAADFKYTKITVERPLRLEYEITDEKIEALKKHPKFIEFATSKKKDKASAEADIAKGKVIQEKILQALATFNGKAREASDANFFAAFEKAFGSKPNKALLKMYRDALGEKDEKAEVVFADPFDVPVQKGRVCDWNEKPVQDTDLRDSEGIKWKENIEEYFEKEVLPFAPDAWMDREKDKIGYEIPFTKFFYEYKPLRDLEEIMQDIEALEQETEDLLSEIKGDYKLCGCCIKP
ncbi:type I restriction-modification system subunit M [bacterium]|nr:type I restriction-modification system subunit M [bacterium]MBU1753747.1 type I restriction-modification system subunit M [bacterium]